MIDRIYKHPYGKYFLSLEADPGPDSIVVKYRKRNRKDYTAEPDEAETPKEDTATDDDTTDYSADDADAAEDTDTANNTGADETTDYSDEDTGEDGGEEETDDTEVSDEADEGEEDYTDGSDEEGSDENETDNGNTDDTEGDTGDGGDDGTDYTDDGTDGGGDGGDDGNPDDSGDSGENNSEQDGPGLDYDSTRKYVLYTNFNSLLNGINNYISKLETLLGEDTEVNHVMKTCVKKLRMIRDLTYDYLIMKYEISSYIQSKLFYTNMIAMIQTVFSVIWKTNHLVKMNGDKRKTK